jgi:hypothetical protein
MAPGSNRQSDPAVSELKEAAILLGIRSDVTNHGLFSFGLLTAAAQADLAPLRAAIRCVKTLQRLQDAFQQGGSRLSKQTQLIIFLILLAIVDTVIPVPITALVLIMVVFQKPGWFRDVVDTIYLK